ncbi:MAG: type I-U CRISPR-associated protein Csx17 [Pirellulaceae bacterium]
MSLQITELMGVRPSPLADYLKAIGILRIVSEQVDRDAVGWWCGESFRLGSTMVGDELCRFFLDDYSPTPLITPWNGGSGFYRADQKGAWHKGFERVMNSEAPRFQPYRDAIEAGQKLLGDRQVKFDANESDLKEQLLQRASQQWRGPLADWLRAALSITADGSPVYPAILGTGGNDGRLDFTNNFMQRLAELFDLTTPEATPFPATIDLIRESILGVPTTDLGDAPIGQFAPGAAGGVNSGVGFRTTPQVNPFDFILMLEGAIAFSPSIVRRASPNALPQAAAPFAVYSGTGGYASSVPEENSRGEQWMPIWSRPTSYLELKQVIGEARCRVGGKSAKRPRDVAQAIARCGVARGISGFQRFAYLERNGQANLAVSLGRWQVGSTVPYADLLPQLDRWVDQLERAARAGNVPASWMHHARVVDDCVMNCCRVNSTNRNWLRLLQAVGEAEETILKNPRAAASASLQPLFYRQTGLSPLWIEAACEVNVDAMSELRLAVALASQAGPRFPEYRNTITNEAGKKSPLPNGADPLRRHFLPLAQDRGSIKSRHEFAKSDESLTQLSEVVVRGLSSVGDLEHLVRRRIQMATRRNDWHHLPIVPTRGLEASTYDLQRWIAGELDEHRIVSVARTLTAVDWNQAWHQRESLSGHLGIQEADQQSGRDRSMLAGWATIRLCFHWDDLRISLRDPNNPESSLRKTVRVAVDPKIFANLASGRASQAVRFAAQRLRASGLPVRCFDSMADSNTAKRWAASLAWSLSHASINRLAATIVHRSAVEFESMSV